MCQPHFFARTRIRHEARDKQRGRDTGQPDADEECPRAPGVRDPGRDGYTDHARNTQTKHDYCNCAALLVATDETRSLDKVREAQRS